MVRGVWKKAYILLRASAAQVGAVSSAGAVLVVLALLGPAASMPPELASVQGPDDPVWALVEYIWTQLPRGCPPSCPWPPWEVAQ